MFRLSIITLGLVAILAADASACGRCGLFGNRCRFHHVAHVQHVAPVVVQEQPDVQNFVFNNVFPVPFLAAQGSSVYGYSLAASAYTFDPNLFLDRSARLAELALQTAQAGNDGANAVAQGVLAANEAADRRAKNTVLALAAMEANGQGAAQAPQSFRVSIVNGKLSIETIDAKPAGPTAGDPAEAVPPFAAFSCAACHDGKGGANRPPADSIIDGKTPLSEDRYRRAVKRVADGSMPPNTQLSAEDKAAVYAELARQLAK